MTTPVFTEDGTRSSKAQRLASLPFEEIPDSFLRNTVKEELVLEYAEHFRRQFVQLFPERAPLLLAPPNEAGVPKFVCTTLRPSQPAVKELYDLKSCAAFVASYVQYEPLDPPDALPAQLPAPSTVLATRSGDAFDMSVLLASLLLGNGYDAYVAVGTAPRWVTLRNEGMTRGTWAPPPDAVNRAAYPGLAEGPKPVAGTGAAAAAAAPNTSTTNKYKLPPPASLDSDFLAAQAARAAAEAAGATTGEVYDSDPDASGDELSRLRVGAPAPPPRVPAIEKKRRAEARTRGEAYGQTPEQARAEAEASAAASDPLHGRRVHAWVVVRAGKRDVASTLFVEASTGAILDVAAAAAAAAGGDGVPYQSLEVLFNHKNYYVNMQAQPLLPRQAAQDGIDASPLAPHLRAALGQQRRGPGVTGSGGMIAASAVVSTLAGGMGGELAKGKGGGGGAAAGSGARGAMLSPYMNALNALKEVQQAELMEAANKRKLEKAASAALEKAASAAPPPPTKGKDGAAAAPPAQEPKEERVEPEPPAAPSSEVPLGAPLLRGPASEWALAHPRPPKPKTVAAPPAKKGKGKAAAAAATTAAEDGGDSAAASGEGSAPGAGEDGGAPAAEGEAAEGGEGAPASSSSAEGGGEGAAPAPAPAAAAEEEAPAQPSEEAEETPSESAAGEGGSAPIRPQSSASKPGTASSALRPSQQSRPGTRARPPGFLHARPWKEVLGGQTADLQSQLAAMLAAEEEGLPGVGALRWDLRNSDDWEFVLIPSERPGAGDGEDGEDGEGGEGGEGGGAAGGGGLLDDALDGLGAVAAASPPAPAAPEAVAGESKDGDHKDGEEGGEDGSGAAAGAGAGAAGAPGSGDGGPPSRAPSAARAPPKKDRYAGLVIELDGEHILDLPPSWCPTLVLDRATVRDAADAGFGSTRTFFKARLQTFRPHDNPIGLVARHTAYADAARLHPVAVTEVFSRRRDGLYKRVRLCGRTPVPAAQVVEEHFERGSRPGGLALVVEELGKRRETYYYHGARIDGLLVRTEYLGRKVVELFDPPPPSRLWYRSVTFATPADFAAAASSSSHHGHGGHGRPGSGSAASASTGAGTSAATTRPGSLTSTPGGVGGGAGVPRPGGGGGGAAGLHGAAGGGLLTVEVEHKLEQPLRKMSEKYRRDPTLATPAHEDVAKAVYLLTEGLFQVRYHVAAGRIARSVRQYSRVSGSMAMLTSDPGQPALRPYDVDQAYRAACAAEKEGHTAARAQAKAGIELRQVRAWECAHVDLDKTVFEVAAERAARGEPLEEQGERKEGECVFGRGRGGREQEGTLSPDSRPPFIDSFLASSPLLPLCRRRRPRARLPPPLPPRRQGRGPDQPRRAGRPQGGPGLPRRLPRAPPRARRHDPEAAGRGDGEAPAQAAGLLARARPERGGRGGV
jgi:hypothetical protein